MAIYNSEQSRDTITLAENVGAYFAVARDDRKLANTGEEAAGLLIAAADSGDHATMAISGVSKFVAGGAITVGGKMTVATSGYVVAGDSGDYIVGECRNTVTSGSTGTGVFNFATAAYLAV